MESERLLTNSGHAAELKEQILEFKILHCVAKTSRMGPSRPSARQDASGRGENGSFDNFYFLNGQQLLWKECSQCSS